MVQLTTVLCHGFTDGMRDRSQAVEKILVLFPFLTLEHGVLETTVTFFEPMGTRQSSGEQAFH